ncbi:MAG TPA: septum formation initiator family protein [Longimicrobium sp.]|nr:septum formation initiator family protein [Longimicrobium sp.]
MKPGWRLLAAGVLALAGYYAVWGGEYSAFDLLTIRRDRRAAEEELARARHEVDSLKAYAGKLRDDDATVERIARERFGMIRDGELLYRFAPDSAPARGSEASAGP